MGSRIIVFLAALTILILLPACSDDPVEDNRSELEILLDDVINPRIGVNDPGIAIGVLYNNETVISKGYGLANLSQRIPMSPNTPQNLCSVSKSFTAVAVMICEEQGLLEFDDNIREYFPWMPEKWDGITIHHLLTNQSGIPDYINDLGEHFPGITNEEAIQIAIAADTVYFEPGTQWRYCNTGWTILAQLVENVTDNTFEDFTRDNMFLPAGMSNTFYFSENVTPPPDRAIGYSENHSLADWTLRTIGEGGLVSTIEDIFKWEQALHNELVVTSESLDWAMTNHSGEAYYGYGWQMFNWRGHIGVSHSGGWGGFGNYYCRVPGDGFAVIYCSNGSQDFANDVLGIVFRYYFGE